MYYKENIEKIFEFRRLGHGWNSSNALPITDDAIQSALNFIEFSKEYPCPFQAVPRTDGGILIECPLDGYYLDFDILPDGRMKVKATKAVDLSFLFSVENLTPEMAVRYTDRFLIGAVSPV